MPADLALPALRALAAHRTADARREALSTLRSTVPTRTLLNAYVLPSLGELRLFSGSLRAGRPTRFGMAVARASEPEARLLMARHLIGLDSERVGFVDWVLRTASSLGRRHTLSGFASERIAPGDPAWPAFIDRLGKWVGYLVFFGIVREHQGKSGAWSVSERHISALRSGAGEGRLPPRARLSTALLDAYARASQELGTRLYIPVAVLRDELGRELESSDVQLTDTQLDSILRRAPSLLREYVVSFSPFSGPARGGLKLDDMYAGYISIRLGASESIRRPD